MKTGVRLSATLLLAAALSGCAVLGAGHKMPPPLDVPAAPPRVVAEFPVELDEPRHPPSAEEAPPAAEPAHEAGVTADAAVEAVAASPPAPEAETTADATPPPNLAQEPEPPPLQLGPAPEDTVDAAVIRRGLRSAALILDGIDGGSLDAPARAQRDTARRFLVQATAALQAGNVTFARYLTEKAEALARDLGNR